MPFKGEVDNKNVIIYSPEYYSAVNKNNFTKFEHKWMNIEQIILSDLT